MSVFFFGLFYCLFRFLSFELFYGIHEAEMIVSIIFIIELFINCVYYCWRLACECVKGVRECSAQHTSSLKCLRFFLSIDCYQLFQWNTSK